ncbi:hypothetical protein, conserved [Eimeria praecox]|uniref:Uncharacterized protein n=1 Tax=Eimeria praecox TaxID=51316 RepID=U6GZN6_9EIME|nr:hypothetical protein, conserved [Eimeria praecox]
MSVSSPAPKYPPDQETTANDIPSFTHSLHDSTPEAANEISAEGGGRGESVYAKCLSAFWKGIFEPHIACTSTEQRLPSPWIHGCWCWRGSGQQLGPEDCECVADKEEISLLRPGIPALPVASEEPSQADDVLVNENSAVARHHQGQKTIKAKRIGEGDQALPFLARATFLEQLRRKQRRPKRLLMQEGQRQLKELFFGPAWAFSTSFFELIFSSCVGRQTPLHHEDIKRSAESQRDDDVAVLKPCQRAQWNESNLQLACGTRCRSLRRVKDEGRQVWMEYQEVTLLDNSRRFQWVELMDSGKGAVE